MVANYRHIEYWMVATKQTIIVKIKNCKKTHESKNKNFFNHITINNKQLTDICQHLNKSHFAM